MKRKHTTGGGGSDHVAVGSGKDNEDDAPGGSVVGGGEQRAAIASSSLLATRLVLPSFSRLRSRADERDHLALVVDGVCTKEECRQYIALAESHGFGPAKLHPDATTTREKVRSSGRVVVENMEVAMLLWQRLAPLVPRTHVAGWTPIGVHESLRFLKYSEGDFFLPHYDRHML